MSRSCEALEARLELERIAVAPGERLVCTLVNTGELAVTYGADYWLELLVDGAWSPSETPHTPMVAPMWARTLTPGARDQLEVHVPDDVPAGRHRVCQPLSIFMHEHADRRATGAVQPLTVHAEFKVVVLAS